MNRFIWKIHTLYRTELISVLVSTFFYGITLYWTGNFKSAALASGIAVVVAALFMPTCEILVSAISAVAAVAISVIIALASASIAAGVRLAAAPVPVKTPSPSIITAVAILITFLFIGVAIFSTVRKAAEMNITKKRAAFSVLIEIWVIIWAFFTISHFIL
jgi:hypothetical protein